MGFKLKGAPYEKDDMNIAVYRKDIGDGSAAKSNHTGIILQTGISPEEEGAAIAHEKVHQYQQRNGDLDYDEKNFYWKGKTYPRQNLNEHNEKLPWEVEAYKESDKILKGKQNNQQMRKKFELRNGDGNGASFANLTSKGLMGASLNTDPVSTKVKRPSTKSSNTSNSRKQLESQNKKAFNLTEAGKPLSANITKLSQKINSKNKQVRESARKEYATATNLYRKAFSLYEKKANDSLQVDDKSDLAIQKKTKVDKARQKAGKVAKFDPKKASNFKS